MQRGDPIPPSPSALRRTPPSRSTDALRATFPLNAFCASVGRAIHLAAGDRGAGGGFGDDGLGGLDFAFEAADAVFLFADRAAQRCLGEPA